MMKKVILLIVLCMAAVFLSGCIGSTDDAESSIRVTIEDPQDHGVLFPSAMELIYEDEFYRYYLNSVRSGSIMLTFEDGERISLRDALSQDKISIEDLILNGLSVHRTPNW